MRETDVAAALEVYSMSSAARTVAVSDGTTINTRHGLVLPTTPAATASPTLDRTIAPGSVPARDGSSYDAALQELAASTNPATARSAAKLIDYPIGHLRSGGRCSIGPHVSPARRQPAPRRCCLAATESPQISRPPPALVHRLRGRRHHH